MSSAAEVLTAIAAVRDAVTAGVPDLAAGVRRGLSSAAVASPTLSRDESGLLSLVIVDVPEPLALTDLESAYGRAARLPRRPSGGRRTVQFGATIPAEGETGATVLAELDDEGRVARIIVRRDEL